MSGNGGIKEPGRSTVILGCMVRVCKLKGTSHRDAKVAVEVGLADSTRRTGKPATWGSGWAKLELS